MKKNIFLITTALMLCSAHAVAQNGDDDFGGELSVEVEKKIKPGLSVEAGISFRSQDDSKDMERFMASIDLSYRLFQTRDKKFNIKSSIGFDYILKQNLKETSKKYDDFAYDESGALIGSKEDYYKGYNVEERFKRNRYRGNLAFSFNYKPSKRWNFSLKETFQYNHYASADSINRYKYRLNDDDEPYLKEADKKYIATKDRWILRNKFTVEYNIKGLPLNPFASVDFGVGLSKSTFKQKYTAGLDFNINKQNRLTTWYRFSHEDDDDEPNGHLVGLSYKFEF